MPAKKRSGLVLGRSIWFWVAVVAAVVAVAFLIHSETFTDGVASVAEWAEDIISDHPVPGAIVFFALSMVAAMLGAASSAVLVPPAVEVWGHLLTFALLWGGWMTGTMIAYWIGGRARPLLAKLGIEKELKHFEHFVTRRTKFWTILLFCLAAPTEVASYLLGSARYPFARFMLAMGISEAVYAVGVILFGDSLVEADSTTLLIVGAVLIAVVVGAGVLLMRLKRKAS